MVENVGAVSVAVENVALVRFVYVRNGHGFFLHCCSTEEWRACDYDASFGFSFSCPFLCVF